MAEFITKAEFAGRRKVSSSAVSNMIRRGEVTVVRGMIRWDPEEEEKRAQSVEGIHALRERGQELKNERMEFELAKERGQYISKKVVDANFFAWAQAERDFWMAWPDRASALIAAELGVDMAKVHIVLTREVRSNLSQLSELEVPVMREDD